MDKILRLDAGIVAQLAELDVGRLLGAHVHLNLSGRNGSDDSGHPIAVIQSLERLLQQFLKGLLFPLGRLDFFAHRCIYLLNDARRRGGASRKARNRTTSEKFRRELVRPLNLEDA